MTSHCLAMTSDKSADRWRREVFRFVVGLPGAHKQYRSATRRSVTSSHRK